VTEAALVRHGPDHPWGLITVALPAGGVVAHEAGQLGRVPGHHLLDAYLGERAQPVVNLGEMAHRLFDWLVRLLIWSRKSDQSVGGSDPSQRKPGDRRRK
jgi:hypothetical protein